MLFVLIYHMITFSDEYAASIIGRDYCGFSLIGWTIFLFGTNFCLIVGNKIKASIHACRIRFLKKRQARFMEDYAVFMKAKRKNLEGKIKNPR